MNKYQEALNDIKDYSFDIERLQEDFETLQELIYNYQEVLEVNKSGVDELNTLRKALLLACEKISFNEESEEAETQEEAQDNYIYKKYSRPKELMERYIKKANEK